MTRTVGQLISDVALRSVFKCVFFSSKSQPQSDFKSMDWSKDEELFSHAFIFLI